MLILASASPARKALLAATGLRFDACPAAIDERALEAAALLKGGDGREVALALAQAKAAAVAAQFPGATVIGADQILQFEGQLLHKPVDRAAAARQLWRLRGRAHELVAGVSLVRDGKLLWDAAETATICMREFSENERDRLLELEGDAVLASVGGYRLEGPSVQLIASVAGDYFTVLGLPLLALLEALRRHHPDLLEGFT